MQLLLLTLSRARLCCFLFIFALVSAQVQVITNADADLFQDVESDLETLTTQSNIDRIKNIDNIIDGQKSVSSSTPEFAERQQNNNVLPPIFVMNLDRSPERWSKASKAMEKAGLQVNRLPAVDGRVMSRQELLKHSTRLALFFQPKGVIGCYLSHRKFWQMVVDQNMEYAVIMEDDIQLVDNFKEKFIAYLQEVNNINEMKKFDIILLGAIGRAHPEGKDHILTKMWGSYVGTLRRTNIYWLKLYMYVYLY